MRTGTNNDGVPARIRESGEVVPAPSYFALPPIRSGNDQYDEDTLTVAHTVQTHTLKQSRRLGGHVSGWDFTEGGMANLPLIRREGVFVADFYFEDAPATTKLVLNPTNLGAWSSYWGRLDDNPANEDHPILGSPITHYRNGVGGKSAFAEACAIPLDFATDSDQGYSGVFPLSNGGNTLTPTIYHRMRMFQRVDVNFGEIEGLHRITGWTFFPEVIVPSVATATIAQTMGLTMCDWFNAAWAYDPYTQTPYTFQGMFGTALDWTGFNNTTMSLTGTTLKTVGYAGWTTSGDQVVIGYWPTQGKNRRVIETGFIQESLDPLGAGVDCYTGIYFALTNQYGEQTFEDGWATNATFQRYRGGIAVADRTYPNKGIQLSIGTTSGIRPAGWQSQQLFFITASSRAQVQAKMDIVKANGWALRKPDVGMLPAHVRADAECQR